MSKIKQELEDLFNIPPRVKGDSDESFDSNSSATFDQKVAQMSQEILDKDTPAASSKIANKPEPEPEPEPDKNVSETPQSNQEPVGQESDEKTPQKSIDEFDTSDDLGLFDDIDADEVSERIINSSNNEAPEIDSEASQQPSSQTQDSSVSPQETNAKPTEENSEDVQPEPESQSEAKAESDDRNVLEYDKTSETKKMRKSRKSNKEDGEKPVLSDYWQLDSPSPEFESFYKRKKSLLAKILPGGFIPFDEWTQELIDCKVEIDMHAWDKEQVREKMQLVQKWRDRVKEIQVSVNYQHFLWERTVSLLEGVLFKIKPDIKPSEARRGLVLDHMEDMELYYGRLKGIYSSADLVLKNLDKAYENLSRQVTLFLPQKNIERYEQSSRLDVYDNTRETSPGRSNSRNKKELDL